MALVAAAALAMGVANSGLGPTYFGALHARLGPLSVHHWINDGLMALFSLLVGLEIKREFLDGRLSRWSDRGLPVVAAAAGMTVPALVFVAVAGGVPGLALGWAIPAATDIAFALGVLALLGSRAPTSIKLLLLTIAIVDDVGAVAIIALFYTTELNLFALADAGLLLILMAELNFRKVERLLPHLVLAVLLWLPMLLSGVHATVAGVLAAVTIPSAAARAARTRPTRRFTGSNMRSSLGPRSSSWRCSASPTPVCRSSA